MFRVQFIVSGKFFWTDWFYTYEGALDFIEAAERVALFICQIQDENYETV